MIFLYVLDDETPGEWRLGGASRWWLHRSLESLGAKVPLVLRRGLADKVIGAGAGGDGAASVHFARDYAPWSPALERRVKEVCDAAGAACHRYGGFLLHEPESIRNGSGEPYRVYTPFSKACFAAGEPKAAEARSGLHGMAGHPPSDRLEDWGLLPTQPDWAQGFGALWTPGRGGRAARLEAFIADGLAHYADERDRPDRDVTSRLSPHLRFGEVSPAQCWHAVRAAQLAAGGKLDRAAEKFLKEVLWREFSYHLLHHWPTLPSEALPPGVRSLPVERERQALSRPGSAGRTGYPIVDAGHARAVGDRHHAQPRAHDRRLLPHQGPADPLAEGERWFWDTLVDADIGSNAASWQWVAGCGADAAPYFRIFNPVLQGEKFDPQGAYVRKWVPELARLPDEFIHKPWAGAAPRAACRRC